MTARDYTRFFRGGWVIILASTLLAGLGAGIVSVTKQPVYVATSTLAVSTCVAVENSPVCDPVGGMSFAIQRASIYEKTGTSLPVLRRALELTDAVSKRSTLMDNTSVAQTADSPIIDVTATWHDADGAAEIANAMSVAIVEYARGSVDRFESEMTTVDFTVINEAVAPSEPLDDTAKTVALAITLGLLVGLLLALVRYHSDKRVRDRDEVESETGLSVLATIRHPTSRAPLGSTTQSSRASESFRRLSSATATRLAGASFHTLLIASPDDSKSSGEVARGLAEAMAETGAHVTLANLVTRTVETLHEKSLLDVAAPTGPSRAVGDANAMSVPRRMRSIPVSQFGSSWLAEVSAEISDTAGILIVDAAPVLKSADSLSAARHADGVILVVDVGRTQLHDLRESVRSLELVGTKPLGIAILT